MWTMLTQLTVPEVSVPDGDLEVVPPCFTDQYACPTEYPSPMGIEVVTFLLEKSRNGLGKSV